MHNPRAQATTALKRLMTEVRLYFPCLDIRPLTERDMHTVSPTEQQERQGFLAQVDGGRGNVCCWSVSCISLSIISKYRELIKFFLPRSNVGPVTESDFFIWEALICGPEETPFEGGVFTAILTFPHDYPLSPPKVSE